MKIETKYDIASSVNIGAEYDKGVKKLFKSKEIIVPIMEMVIPEFEGCSQEEILNCLDLASITSDEVVSDAPVSETDEYRIRGEDTELSGGSDKLIRFDSKFRIRNPKLFNLDLSGGCTGKIKEYNDRIPNKERRYSGRDGRTGRRL